MTDAEIHDVLGLLDTRTLEVPFSTALFAGAEEIRSTLAKEEDGTYRLETFFREHAPGHGFSCEQSERESLTRSELIEHLRRRARSEITPQAPAAMSKGRDSEA
jgi:hypothetical protein